MSHQSIITPGVLPLPTPNLAAALAFHRAATANLLDVLSGIFHRGAALTLALPDATTGEEGQDDGAAGEEYAEAMAVVCDGDGLSAIALQVRIERTGRVIEVPLTDLLR